MGLDNGITVKRNSMSNSIKALCKFTCDYDKSEQYDFEFAYWRKCWNVYYDIERVLAQSIDNDTQVELTVDNVIKIIKLLKSYNKATWGDRSIWSWKDHKRINRKHIRNLKQLVRLMRKYPDLIAYFYVSY